MSVSSHVVTCWASDASCRALKILPRPRASILPNYNRHTCTRAELHTGERKRKDLVAGKKAEEEEFGIPDKGRMQ